ncbi:DNA polymerase III subunit delta' [Candidatus Endobugula sertula]|uniref:DNA-directed DNA polymerase n=1 Tax=Candidatus Endobugula sertula TaxID=62101 RepID=A0A1D2QSH8_9GAMM|nr:DNA polymerase III subunit delta' [Candidatus Endobugula sertula]
MSESPSVHIPYPWQQDSWQKLQLQVVKNKIPHALLLAGQKGIGKWHFAEALADYLLCLSPKAELACGQCRGCQLLLANSHPDKQIFIPEGVGKLLKIEQVRQLSTFVGKTAQQGGRKIVILGPVEQLNINAANALLKNLEEPAGDTVLILVSHVASAVMATIRSRCQMVPLLTPDKTIATTWLKELQIDNAAALLHLSGGAPLIAKAMLEGDDLEHLQTFITTLLSLSQRPPAASHIAVAKDWLGIGLSQIIAWWLQIIHGMLVYSFNDSNGSLKNKDNINTTTNSITSEMDRLLASGYRFNRQWLLKFSDKLILLRQQQLQGANPNMPLLIDELLLDWQVIVGRS